jgi:hypothetical protein
MGKTHGFGLPYSRRVDHTTQLGSRLLRPRNRAVYRGLHLLDVRDVRLDENKVCPLCISTFNWVWTG